jgi:hypothetical protein
VSGVDAVSTQGIKRTLEGALVSHHKVCMHSAAFFMCSNDTLDSVVFTAPSSRKTGAAVLERAATPRPVKCLLLSGGNLAESLEDEEEKIADKWGKFTFRMTFTFELTKLTRI